MSMYDYMTVTQLQKNRRGLEKELSEMLRTASRQNRNLTEDEARQWEGLEDQIGEIDDKLLERQNPESQTNVDYRLLPGGDGSSNGHDNGARWVNPKTGEEIRTLAPEDAFTAPGSEQYTDKDVGAYLRARLTGDYRNLPKDLEERAMSIGTDSAGGFIVPAPLSSRVIQLARNQTRVMQAGAVTVPMSSQTLDLAKVDADATPGWRGENASVTESDITLAGITLEAKSLGVIVRLSRELFDDGANTEDVIVNSLAAKLAVELDRAAMFGSGTGSEPEGVRNNSSFAPIDMGENGAALENYDEIVAGMRAVWDANYTPNAAIMAPRTRAELAVLKDTTNQPLQAPDVVNELRMLQTNQVPVDESHGTADNASTILLGQWNQLLIGMRQELRIQFLSERYADNLQVAFLAYLRADVAPAEIDAFSGVEGIVPPA